MNRHFKVNIILVITTIVAIIIAIFAVSRLKTEEDFYAIEHEKNLKVLNDTIKELKEDIARYKLEIDRIDLEKEKIRKEVKLIIKNNEKTDAELANGNWDDNIRHITDFLSEEDSVE